MKQKLSASEFQFYEWIRRDPQAQYATAKEMAEVLEVTPRRINQLLKSLQDKGYIAVKQEQIRIYQQKVFIL